MSGSDPTQIFLQEAQDLLEQLEQTLLDLEYTPADTDLIDTAFRALHTIKGSGAMFGFDAVAAFTHHVENAFDLVRKGKLTPTKELIAVALRAKDQMRVLIDHPSTASASGGEAILSDLLRLMEAATGSSAAGGDRVTGSADAAAAADAEAGWRVRFRLPIDAMATGTNPLLLLDELRGLGTASVVALTDAVPLLEEIDPGATYLHWDVLLRTDQPRAAIEEVFIFVIDDMELEIERPVPPIGEVAPRPIEDLAGAADAAEKPDAVVPAPVESSPVESGGPQDGLADRRSAKRVNDTVRVPAERLDELMDRVGELVIAQSRLKQVAAASNDAAVKSVAEEIERLSLELRDTTMGVRMLPISSLFGRFRRLVHDLARDLGKKIDLVTIGEETELDKTVIERLNDPLIHLIRNAIDHGLEDPDGRAAAGKPAQGRITLTAEHVGAEVLVSITDDGRGLDRTRIRARAEENGLVVPGAKLSDNELFQVIFQPGFSTAHEVTNLSGRGVGMDVVKRTIDGLRGKIDIASRPGRGSTMTLRLPLTLAIIDGLLVRVGRGRYVIPLSAVEECVELSTEEDARSRGRSFLNIRGDLVPFLRLRELFNASAAADRYQKVVVVSAGELRVGLVVDQVIGDHQTVIKSMSKLHADVEIFSGATILGDGTIALILDIGHLVEHGQQQEERLKAAG
ncbi:MAG: two-component system, chemotaxis family, sensor kinase CheA [Acetobacteraceae bacterium]|nr:two-component system, chemotaxis family, sensor kinase CheA [Acetobacteraceae bacterium]